MPHHVGQKHGIEADIRASARRGPLLQKFCRAALAMPVPGFRVRLSYEPELRTTGDGILSWCASRWAGQPARLIW